MVELNIKLNDNGRGFYFAGEELKGVIVLEIKKPKLIRGLYFNIYGAAHCKWTEMRKQKLTIGGRIQTGYKTSEFKAKEIFLNKTTYVLGNNKTNPHEIQSGLHSFEFAYLLSETLPGNYEADKGNIRYYIEAVLDVPWDTNEESLLQFVIVNKNDLNQIDQAKIPIEKEEFKTFCCSFCITQPLMMTAKMPFTGFSPGQTMRVIVDYVNKSNLKVRKTKFQLERIIKYTSQRPFEITKTERKTLLDDYGAGVQRRTEATVVKDISLPRVLFNSNDRFCKILQVYYELKVQAKVSGLHKSLKLYIPIVIGLIPLSIDEFNFIPAAPCE